MVTLLGAISGIYSIGIGVAIIGLWIMLITKKKIPELKTEPITIYFHITAEITMGLMAVISGIFILLESLWSKYLFLISSGICVYAVINSAGYYAQRKIWVFIGLFGTIFTLSCLFSILTIVTLIYSS